MKKFAILAAVVALIGCTQNDEGLDNITSTPEKSQTEFYASMPECDTRTYVEDNKYLRWNAGDEITVFAGNSYNGHWQFAGEDGANSGKFNEIGEGGFVTGTPLDLTANYAIYPYDKNISISEAGVVSLTLPAVQEYNHTYANSFGAGANTMMAVTKNTSDNFLAFKNLCGYLKLKFYGEDVTVKSITVKGNNGEKIAGPATVSMAYGNEPTITMGNDATDTITIDCGEGVVLSNDAANPTTFWVVIPEITFEGGITIEVTDINDQIFKKKTTNAVPIENNLIQPMAALEVVCAKLQPNNEIWYTSTDGNIVTPYKTDVFGANIVSNTYENGQGIIKFDAPITSIGEYAFYNCKRLSSVTIPYGVTWIGANAFRSCSNLASVTIPNSVTWTGANAFQSCSSLKGVYISDITAWCYIYFADSKSNPLYYAHNLYLNNKLVTDLIIPDSATAISQYAFINCSNLTSITIGKGVGKIETAAFYGCKGKLIINSKVVEGNYLISGYHPSSSEGWLCGAMFTSVTIGNDITSIGDYVFYDCSSLTSVTIGNSVTSIGYYAFENCTSLTSVYISDIAAWCNISINTYGSPLSYANLYLNNKLVTNVIIPDGVTRIGKRAFAACKSLKTITIPSSVTVIGASAFRGCSNLASVTISDGVSTIGDCAFEYCNALQSVVIPNSVTSIGDYAFEHCTRLASVYCKPTTPPYIGDYVFNNNKDGCYIYVPSASVSAYVDRWGDSYKSSIKGYNYE